MLEGPPGGLEMSESDDVEANPGLTAVHILDFNLTRHINFEAEINYPEEEGIVQVECFGLHIRVDGPIVYGMHIEAILDRWAAFEADHPDAFLGMYQFWCYDPH